jgi:hypothetical protein
VRASFFFYFLTGITDPAVMPHPITVNINPTGTQTVGDAHFEPMMIVVILSHPLKTQCGPIVFVSGIYS